MEKIMNVTIIATKTCSHRPILERELQELEVPYIVRFVEDHPEIAQKHDLHQSPNLLVDDQMVFRRRGDRPLPSPSELKQILNLN
jgi:glutaredoxin